MTNSPQETSPEVRRSIQAGLDAYLAALAIGMDGESALLFSRMAFEDQFAQGETDRKMLLMMASRKMAQGASLKRDLNCRRAKKQLGYEDMGTSIFYSACDWTCRRAQCKISCIRNRCQADKRT